MAAVDCGTNSTRLLVVDPCGTALRRTMRITRLGQGVDATGFLAPEAVSRTLSVLAEYRGEMDALGVGRLRVSATSAVRDAANREDFLDAAGRVLGSRPELLSGEEEGQLSFAGATAELEPSGGPYVVVDVGGGSTEVVLGPAPAAEAAPGAAPHDGPVRPLGAVSADVGCVRVTERFLGHDPPTPDELASARRGAEAELRRAVSALPGLERARCMVGLAGTVTTLAAISLGLDVYDPDRVHHSLLTRDGVQLLLEGLAGDDRTARLARPGLEPERADVIVGGAVVLAAVMDVLGMPRCLVSELDILDGLAMSLLGRHGPASR